MLSHTTCTSTITKSRPHAIKARVAGKTFLQILFFYLMLTQICFAQWYEQSSGTTSNLNSVHFEDANNGWAVGDSGTILLTTNGGTDWTPILSGTTNDFNDICFTDANNGWAVGGEMSWNDSLFRYDCVGIILHTSDAGVNWVSQSGDTLLSNLNAVYFVDSNIGWAVGEIWGDSSDAIILHTTNGGANWIQQVHVAYGIGYRHLGLRDVYFSDANTGTAVGGGEGNWSRELLLRTTDGGTTWVKQHTGPDNETPNLKGVTFTNTVTGFVVGNSNGEIPTYGEIWHTIDGGSTWSIDSTTILGNGYFLDVFFTDFDNGTVIGYFWPLGEQEGVILHTIDAGANWIKQTSGTMNSLNGVFFTDALTGWVVGDNGTILHTSNGGGVVPVELNSFTATANSKEVTLSWSTATELNNQGFEVQRKFSDNSFSTIGSVKGHGTTTSPNNYAYIDKLTDAGKYFYRLKQIDFGGKYEYSQVVEIN